MGRDDRRLRQSCGHDADEPAARCAARGGEIYRGGQSRRHELPGRQVGTVGKIQAFPGAYNVVPGKVTTSLGLRDLDAAKVQMLFEKIQAEVRQIEKTTGTKFEFKQTNLTPPAPTDVRFRRVIDEAAKQLGFTTKFMPSGAGHDAQEMAHLCPVGMIFVPSRDGISHSPREFSRPEDITNGANVLLHTLLRLDAMKFS